MLDVYRITRCPACGGGFDVVGASLACRACTARYPLVNGVPILHHERKSDTSYAQSASRGELRNSLRRLGLETFARGAYLRFDTLRRRLAPRSPAHPEYWLDRFRAQLPRPAPRRILDFGGGGGAAKSWLAREGDDYLILEVDEQILSTTAAQQGRYVIGDGHDELFAPASFDVIGLFEVLEHMRNPFRVIANCARWLAPGGVLVLSTPQYWHVHGWPSDYFRYTSFGLRMLAGEAGLEIVDLWPMGGPCVLLWCVVDLNFSRVLRAPFVQQTVSHPLLLAARAADRLLFRNNEQRRNPDTRGWMMVARKSSRGGGSPHEHQLV